MLVGLTGGLASGKSLVAEYMKSLGARVIDADYTARAVVQVGEPAYNDIVAEFGTGVLNEDETINRSALGKIVFSAPEKLKKLNSITHPRIRERTLEEIRQIQEAQPERIILNVVPLLIEEGMYKQMDKIIVVTADEELRINRYIEREGKTKEDALNIIDKQMKDEEKIKYADFVLVNNGTLAEIKEKAREVYDSLASKN